MKNTDETSSTKRRRRPTMFDVGPSESSALEAAVAAAQKIAAARPTNAVLEKDRERAERALERNLEIVATSKLEEDDVSAGGGAQQEKKGFVVSRAGIGAKGFSKGRGVFQALDKKSSVYVSGLPTEVEEEDLKRHFLGHGKVKLVKIYTDSRDKPKGDALVTFAKEGSARQASALLDGREIKPGFAVSVQLAEFRSDAALTGTGPIVAAEGGSSEHAGEEDGLDAECGSDEKPIVLLRHIFDVMQCSLRPGRSFLDELEEEIGMECSKYGRVLHVCAPSSKEYEGSIAVTFDDVKGAELCCQNMSGRYFDEVQIVVERLGNWDDRVCMRPLPTELSERVAPRDCAVAVIRNAFSDEEVERGGPRFVSDLENEIWQECQQKFGDLRSVFVDSGVVVVAFSSRRALEECREHMDGRWFDLRKLKVDEFLHPNHHERETAAAEKVALSAFFEDIINTKTSS